MTRGRAEERDPEQVPTKSERLVWYRSGGKALIEERDQLARDSSNWMQYKLTRDRQAFSENLEERMNMKWSQVKNRISRDSVAKTMYEINRQPWELEELEEESS